MAGCLGRDAQATKFDLPSAGRLFFVVTVQRIGEKIEREVWSTDGRQFFQHEIRGGLESSNVTELTAVNNTLFMSAEGETFGKELWKLESTEEGFERKLVGRVLPSPRKFVAPPRP